MKKSLSLWILTLVIHASALAGGPTFFIAPNGDDAHPGTKAQPFATLPRAMEAARGVNGDMQQDIQVFLRGGDYLIEEPVVFGPADSGRNGNNVVYLAYGEEEPVLSGGVGVSGWEQHDGDIYRASLDHSTKLRTLIVNGRRAYMASKRIEGEGEWSSYQVREGMADWALHTGTAPAGIRYSKQDLPQLKNPRDVEVMCNTKWNSHIIGVATVGEDDDHRVLRLQQPAGAIAFNQKWGGFSATGQHTLHNAYAFLDEPGEFYFDRKNKTLYYHARPGEDMSSAQAVAPRAGTLLALQGTSQEDRVQNLQFRGITFGYTEAVLPRVGDSEVKTTVQAATWCVAFDEPDWHKVKYRTYDTMPSAVSVSSAESVRFEDNVFKHIGNEAIGLINDVRDTQLVGNLVYDVGGGAIQVGHPQHLYEGDTHPLARYAPGVEGVCTNILIENNVLYDMTLMFYGHAAITAYFVDTLEVRKNHIQETRYTAVSLGWGWNNFDAISVPDNPTTTCRNNTFSNNRVYNCMKMLHDGGAFYTLGSQPGSEASGNYVKAATTHFQGVYHPDDGTAGYTGKDLVFEIVPGQDNFELNKGRRKHNIYFDNVFSTSESQRMGAADSDVTNLQVVPGANWPEEALAIIRAAGPDPAYHGLLETIPGIVFEDGKRYDTKEKIPLPDAGKTTTAGRATPATDGRYEAEDARLAGGATVKTKHAGFTGKGFVEGFYNSDSARITFDVTVEEVGTYTATLRYAAGRKNSSNMALYVNGKKSSVLRCKRTGAWNKWALRSESVLLNAGKNILEIKIERSSPDIINVDYLQISDRGRRRDR